MPEILISGYYGYANAGDEAILAMLLADLRRLAPAASFTVISGNPEETAATHHVNAIHWSDPAAIASAVRHANLVISGGGGIFHDYGGFAPEGLLSQGNWGLGFHVTAGLLAALYGIPHVLYAVGVGPLFSPQAKEMMRAIASSASVITVRDAASASLLSSLGIPQDRIHLTADPAFLLAPGPLPIDLPAGPLLTVVIRHWSHDVQLQQWEQELAAALDQYLAANPAAHVLFLPFQQLAGVEEDDIAAATRVRTRLSAAARSTIVTTATAPHAKAAILAASHAVIAMRLHALIFAASAGVPTVALTYDEKVRQAAARLHLPATLEMSALTTASLSSALATALAAPKPDSSSLATLAAQNAPLALAALDQPPPPLTGPILDLLRRAVSEQLAEQKRLRAWLADQRTNYEFQVSQQAREITSLQARLEAAAALQRDTAAQLQTARADYEQLTADHDDLNSQLATAEEDRAWWEKQAAERSRQLDTLQQQHLQLQDTHLQHRTAWQQYATEMEHRLAAYRSQRPWKAMLALRKAYLISRHSKLALLPFAWRLIRGTAAIESEQLEFPLPPKLK